MLELTIKIPSPSDMQNLDVVFRQFWRIMDVLARTCHKIFLLMGPKDVVVIDGEPTDSFALHAAGQILGQAGWVVLVTENGRQKTLFLGQQRDCVHLVAGQPMPQIPQEENNHVEGQAPTSRGVGDSTLDVRHPPAPLQGDGDTDREIQFPEQA